MIAQAGYSETFDIGDRSFSIRHIKLSGASKTGGAEIVLCANGREVTRSNAQCASNGVAKWLAKNEDSSYIGVITSTYLDENVSSNRLSFDIAKEGGDLYHEISEDQILEAANLRINTFLSGAVEAAASEQLDSVKTYIKESAPQYLHLLHNEPESISAIPFGANEEKIDDELHRAQRKFDKRMSKEGRALTSKLINGSIDTPEFEKELKNHIEQVSSANKAALADYVLRRKAIIELFEMSIGKSASDEKYAKESHLHEILYPMRSTSDDVSFAAHNLWLIDERLTYSSFVSSDMPFDHNSHEDRPDLMFLESPVLMTDEDSAGRFYEAITIFELKRPMRDDYTESDNPINQLLRYASKIRNGNAKDSNHRQIRVADTTRMYLYAICDITPSLENRVLLPQNFQKTPDGIGYFSYNSNFNAYIEVMPFDKVLAGAKMRNQVFFRKLGIL